MSFNKLVFDTTDAETIFDSHSVGSYVRSGKSGALITHHSLAEVAGSGAVNFADGDVTVGTDNINQAAHGLSTGDQVQLTSTGTLPAGLALATDYYVIRIDADNFKLAASKIDAENGDAVDITAAAGGGTHTVTGQEEDRRALDVWLANEAIDVNVLGGVNVEVDLSHVDDSVRLGDGTDFFTSTSENGDVALDVHISNSNIEVTQGTSPWVIGDGGGSITIDSVDLDIRDLAFATDSVDVSGSEVSLDAATLAALETITVEQGTSPWVIGDGGGSITIDSVDLDIRDLTAASDSVQAWAHDGAGTALTSTLVGADQALDVNVVATSDSTLADTAIAHSQQPASADDTAESSVDSILADRKYLFLANKGNKEMVIGGSGVTLATGFPIAPGSYVELRAGSAIDVQWAARTAAGSDLRALELS